MVRRLGPDDVPDAVSLTNAVDWAFDAADFEAMLDMNPDGLFCAEVAGEVVGLTTTATLGDLGWIGNVVVHPDHRHEGMGTDLVETAIGHLKRSGISTVGLYSLPPARAIYDRLGFEPRFEVVSLAGEVGDGAPGTDVDDDAIVDLDRQYVDLDRERYLRYLLDRDDVDAVAGEHGYLLIQRGTVTEIGPGVCDPDHPDAARRLVEDAVDVADGPVEASLPDGVPAVEAYLDAGLDEMFQATTMLLGDHSLYEREAIVGVMGLEKG